MCIFEESDNWSIFLLRDTPKWWQLLCLTHVPAQLDKKEVSPQMGETSLWSHFSVYTFQLFFILAQTMYYMKNATHASQTLGDHLIQLNEITVTNILKNN